MDANRTATMCELSQDLVLEILTHLPVKSLLRFKSVCKSWYSLISSTEFAKLHLERVEQEDNISQCSRILFPCLPMAKSFDFEAASDTGNCEVIRRFDYPDLLVLPDAMTSLNYPDTVLHRDKYDMDIMGSCNGLVFLSNEMNSVVLWNPTTRVSKILPEHSLPRTYRIMTWRNIPPQYDVRFFGLGYDKSVDDYKLIVGYRGVVHADPFVAQSIEILTLKSSRWRKIENQEEVTITRTGIYLGPFIHWIGWRVSHGKIKYEIVSFDIAKEEFRSALPFSEELSNKVSKATAKRLGLSRNCLCLFFDRGDNHIEGWAVEGFGTNATWTNLFVIGGYYSIPLCVTNNGKFIFNHGSFVGLFDTVKGNRYVFDRSCHVCHSCNVLDSSVYLETLVSPYN